MMRCINIIKSSILITTLTFFASCSKDTDEDIIDGQIKTEHFVEGTIEMGIGLPLQTGKADS